jgi:hypothetical protein
LTDLALQHCNYLNNIYCYFNGANLECGASSELSGENHGAHAGKQNQAHVVQQIWREIQIGTKNRKQNQANVVQEIWWEIQILTKKQKKESGPRGAANLAGNSNFNKKTGKRIRPTWCRKSGMKF